MRSEADEIKRHTIEVIKFLTSTVDHNELLRFIPKFGEEDYEFLDAIEDPREQQIALLNLTRKSSEDIHIYVGCPLQPDVDQINIALFGMMVYGEEIKAMLYFEEE